MSMDLKKDIMEAAKHNYAYGSSINFYLNNESVERLLKLRAQTGKPSDEIIDIALSLYEKVIEIRKVL